MENIRKERLSWWVASVLLATALLIGALWRQKSFVECSGTVCGVKEEYVFVKDQSVLFSVSILVKVSGAGTVYHLRKISGCESFLEYTVGDPVAINGYRTGNCKEIAVVIDLESADIRYLKNTRGVRARMIV